jgi:hypothetical protein
MLQQLQQQQQQTGRVIAEEGPLSLPYLFFFAAESETAIAAVLLALCPGRRDFPQSHTG